ncbi:hypothetical protein BH11BAC2_BH11BAC2_04030 [soil metagenome]
MKSLKLLSAFEVILILCILTSCIVIAGIFQAGSGFGLIVVFAALTVIGAVHLKVSNIHEVPSEFKK